LTSLALDSLVKPFEEELFQTAPNPNINMRGGRGTEQGNLEA